MQLAADSLLWAFTFFNTASRRPVQDKAGFRILDFCNEKCIPVLDYAQSSLSGFNVHQ